MDIGIQPPYKLGDTTWMSWTVTGLAQHIENLRAHSPLHEPYNAIVDPELINTSDERPSVYDLGLGFHWDELVVPHARQVITPPNVQYCRDQLVEKAEDTAHYHQTGKMHVLEAWFEVLKEKFPELSQPPLPRLADFEEAWAELSKFFQPEIPLVSINIGSAKESTRYPFEKWVMVAEQLQKRELQVVLVGHEINVDQWSRASRRLSSTQGDVSIFDLTNKLSLLSLAALIAHSDVHTSTDTGTGHLAAATNVATVSLFGLHTISEVCRPYSENGIVLQSDGWTPKELSPESVTRAILEQIRGR